MQATTRFSGALVLLTALLEYGPTCGGDMTPKRWQRTEELYHAARIWPPGERAAFLAEACGDDEPLLRDVGPC